jgi:hypothetical protein
MVISVSNIENAKLILEQIAKYLLDNRKLTIHPLENSSDAKSAIFLNPKQDRMKYLGVIFDGQNLFPTNECCYQLIGKIKNILKSALTYDKKEIAIKKAIAQWCGYYAFTDISNIQIKRMDSSINYQIRKHKLNMCRVNMIDVLFKTRKRQNNRFMKIFNPIKFGEEYGWLNIYS